MLYLLECVCCWRSKRWDRDGLHPPGTCVCTGGLWRVVQRARPPRGGVPNRKPRQVSHPERSDRMEPNDWIEDPNGGYDEMDPEFQEHHDM